MIGLCAADPTTAALSRHQCEGNAGYPSCGSTRTLGPMVTPTREIANRKKNGSKPRNTGWRPQQLHTSGSDLILYLCAVRAAAMPRRNACRIPGWKSCPEIVTMVIDRSTGGSACGRSMPKPWSTARVDDTTQRGGSKPRSRAQQRPTVACGCDDPWGRCL